jgi:hypothetical protein
MRTLYESILDDEDVLIGNVKKDIGNPYKLIKMWIKDCDNEKQISKSFIKVIDDYVISRIKQIPALKNKEMEIFVNPSFGLGQEIVIRFSHDNRAVDLMNIKYNRLADSLSITIYKSTILETLNLYDDMYKYLKELNSKYDFILQKQSLPKFYRYYVILK